MDTAHFTGRNEPRMLVLKVAEVAGSAADEVDRPDSHAACILLDKTQLLLDERSVVLRGLALDDAHDGLARARVAFGEQFQQFVSRVFSHELTPQPFSPPGLVDLLAPTTPFLSS